MMSTYPRWYAVHTRPNTESQADAELRRLGYWTFYPFCRIRKIHKRPNGQGHRIVWLEKPYFLRYLFLAIRQEAESLGRAMRADGVSEIVQADGTPLEIPHPVMDELMGRADEDGLIGEEDYTKRRLLAPGDNVELSPLQGLIAQVSIDTGKEVRLWVELFGGCLVRAKPDKVANIA